jgi:hypothetical protein
LDHAKELGYYKMDVGKYNDPNTNRPDGCAIFKDPNVARPIYDTLTTFRAELQDYQKRVKNFALEDGVRDVRLHLEEGICDKLELHQEGMEVIFKSGALCWGEDSGHVEPLFSPLRDPEFCFLGPSKLLPESVNDGLGRLVLEAVRPSVAGHVVYQGEGILIPPWASALTVSYAHANCMEGGRRTGVEFALVVARDGGDISEGRWSVLVFEDMETLASMLHGRLVRHAASAPKVLLQFKRIDSFDWTGARIGD